MKKWHKITLSILIIASVLAVVFWPPAMSVKITRASIAVGGGGGLDPSNLYYEKVIDENHKARVGDTLTDDFKPSLELIAWNECSIKISLPTAESKTPSIVGEKISWDGSEYGAEFFQEGEEFKFNIILKEKPATNIFTLDFDSDNLVFYYQPPLTEEFKDGWSEELQRDIKVTETQVVDAKTGEVLAERPENVVGSYAAYHTTKSSYVQTKADGDKYRTGKAFHWYRPLIYDDAGHTTWGILNIDPRAGIRTVEIPQDFLDNAIYPVTIDDDFGYQSQGASKYGIANALNGSAATCPSAGTGDSITAYLTTPSGDDFVYGVYDGNNLVTDGTTEEETTDGADTWWTVDFLSSPTLAAQTYRLVAHGESSNTKIHYDSSGTAHWYFYYIGSYSSTLPSPVSFIDVGEAYSYSIYCTFTSSGGEPSLANSPSSKDFGTVADSASYWSSGSEPSWPLTDGDAYFTITNDGSITIDIYIESTDFDGGGGWNLVTGSPGASEARMLAFKEGDGNTDNITILNTQTLFIEDLAASDNIDWELRLDVPTVSDQYSHSANITLEASAS